MILKVVLPAHQRISPHDKWEAVAVRPMNVPMLLYTRNFPEGMFVDLSETNLIHAQMSESLHSLGGIGHNKHSQRIQV